jgi:hypothetical protein
MNDPFLAYDARTHALLDRRVVEAEIAITEQRLRIDRLTMLGISTIDAEAFLADLERYAAKTIEDRQRFLDRQE